MDQITSLTSYFIFIVICTFVSCNDENDSCDQYKGILFERAVCVGEKTTIIQVTNKEIGSTYKNERNIILAAWNYDSIDVSGSIYKGGISFKKGDVLYFDMKEKRIEGITCPSMLGIPSFHAEITAVSKNKCM